MTLNIDLKNLTISSVKPVHKSEHPAVLELSALDNNIGVLDVYSTFILCYKSGKEGDSVVDELANKVKESLSKVLVPYFPFAGRLVKTFDARLRELQCTDEGVPFIEAEVDDEMESVVNLKDFTSIQLQGYRLVGLDPTVFQQNADIPLPSLFVQLTRFKCGGVTINVTVAHQTADGQGMFTFMKAWSDIALDGETSIVPTHDRSQFMPFIESSYAATLYGKQVDSEKFKVSRDGPEAKLKFSQKALQPASDKTLHVKRDVIVKLKREAAENGMEVTTMDLISAHIWRSFTILNESVDEDSTSTLLFAMDGRKKFESPLVPEHFSGNAFVSAPGPSIPASELCPTPQLDLGTVTYSGTTISMLDPSAYTALSKSVKVAVKYPKVSGGNSGLDGCFDTSEDANPTFPGTTFHFDGGDWVLPQENTFLPVDDKGTWCLAMIASTQEIQIFDNTQQQNFQIVYDQPNTQLGWVKTQCAQQVLGLSRLAELS